MEEDLVVYLPKKDISRLINEKLQTNSRYSNLFSYESIKQLKSVFYVIKMKIAIYYFIDELLQQTKINIRFVDIVR